MASSEEFVKYVAEQLQDAGSITYKKMFGEYGLYCNGKFFATICNNQLFIKVTDQGHVLIENPELAPAYEGAKPSFLISELDDKAFLCRLTIATCNALPDPKTKRKD